MSKRLIAFLLLCFLIFPIKAQEPINCKGMLEIWQIQGTGEESNCQKQNVRLEDNIVTAIGIRGFFMQTPAERSDNDPLSSDGIYVFMDSAAVRAGIQVGDRVNVEGRVTEYYYLTEIETSPRRVEVISSGNDVPEPIDLFTADLNWTFGKDVHPLERYEGMLVKVENALVVAPTNYFDEFGVSLTGKRVFREPGIEGDLTPQFVGKGLPESDLNPELVEIDPAEMGLPVDFVTVNSRATIVGGLSYSYMDYQIWPSTVNIDMADFAIRPVRPRADGEFTIATQNMLNLFDTVDDPNRQDSSYKDYVPDDMAAYELRLRKLSAQVRVNLGAPDILAVQEVENARVLNDLALQIHADDPSLKYFGCFQEGNDGRGIDNAFLVRTDRVNLNSCYRMPGSLTERTPTTGWLFGRPPLVLEADLLIGDTAFPITLIDVHIKSLSDADTEPMQYRRMTQASRIAEYVQGIFDQNPDANVAVLGDMNSFQFSDGLVDVVGIISGTQNPADAVMSPETDLLEPNLINEIKRIPEEERYSYIYNSTSQVLDHVLTSPALDSIVTDAQFSRGNADALYTWENEDNGALRSSDHDGLVIYINPTQNE